MPVKTMKSPDICDAVIIGAGLAGTCAAIVLARAGHRVTLVEMRAVHPNEFRAEKMGGIHMELFAQLGLADTIKPLMTEMNDAWIYRFNKPFAHEQNREWGFGYGTLVNGLRAALPENVNYVLGKVAAIATSEDIQRVTLADGAEIATRLVVIATGLGETIRRSLGIRRIETSRQHSMSLGFNLARPARHYPFETLTWYGHGIEHRMAYLTLFPIGDSVRGNLFVYHTTGEDWPRQFRQRAPEMLARMMPEISAICGDFALSGHVETRTIDLSISENHRQPGIVLLGDAFCTTCPVPGVGVSRAMTDVLQLCRTHLPQWLASPGMDAAKVSQFYDDPAKQAIDTRAMASSLYARMIATEPGLPWLARRMRNALVRKGYVVARGWINGDLGQPEAGSPAARAA